MPVRFELEPEKTAAAVAVLAEAGIRDLTKYKICKLVFLADKYHLVRYGRTVTGDRICAMEYGPVPSVVLNALNLLLGSTERVAPAAKEIAETLAKHIALDKKYRNNHFISIRKFDTERYLSPSDLEALHEVIKEHGNKSFEELKAMTHELFAYRKAWADRGSANPQIRFEDLFVEDPDAIEGAFEEMIENYEISRGKPAV